MIWNWKKIISKVFLNKTTTRELYLNRDLHLENELHFFLHRHQQNTRAKETCTCTDNNNKGLLQRFYVFNCASTIFAFVCYVLVSVAATSSSVKHFSSLSKAYLKDACMSYNYVCARFASIVYLTFPFPTSNLHTHKEKEVKSSFEFTNKWLKVLEKTNFSMKPIVSQRVLKTIFLERCCFFSSTSWWCNKLYFHIILKSTYW